MKIKYSFYLVFTLIILSSMPKGLVQTGQSDDPNYKSNQSNTRSDQWIQDLQDNFDNPLWFYDNLNANDRKKIRQALDFAIPRQEIIDSILDGHGFLLATTIVPQTGPYYDPSFVPRTHNLSRSIELLTEVFGYEYGNNNSTTPYDESSPYFKLTFIVTLIDPLRLQWGARISFNYLSIGMDIVYKQYSFPDLTEVILDNLSYENNYDNGGFDGKLISWSGGILPSNLKSGLMFSDGSELNATDVKFSYDSILNETGGFPSYSDYARQLAPENITIINQTAVKFQLHEWGPFSDLTLFGLAILPFKVYTQIPINKWSQDGTNIDNGTIISNGAYEFVSLSNGVGILKNSSIFTPAYTAKFDKIPYNAYPTLNNITVVLQNSVDVALTSLKNSEIDFIDSNLGLTSVFDQIEIGGTATYQTYYGESWQELGLNQASPIWGLDPIDPSLFSTSDSLSTSRDSISSEEISTGHTSVSSEKDFSSVLLDSFIVIIWGSSLFIVGAIIANVVKKE